MPANPASNNPYSRLTSMFANLAQQLGIEESNIGRNLMEPLTSAQIESFYGAADQQIASYAQFEQAYKRALFDEFRSTRKMSAARRRQLKAAGREGAGIDLSLIRNVQERKSLERMLFDDTLRLKNLYQSEGLPGVYLPSSNMYRQTARMAINMPQGEYQPFGDILQQSTFSVDPFAEGVEAETTFRIGTRSLPSVRELQARMQRGGHVNLENLDVGKKLFFIDIERTGVSEIDLARSISVGTGEVAERNGVRTVRMVNGQVDNGARFKTAQLAGVISADPNDLSRTTTMADAVIQKETYFGTSLVPKIKQGNIFDLTSEGGRTNARGYFENLFSQLSDDNAHIVAYNGGFDIKGMITTARSLDADETIIARFEERIANGGLIDVMGMTRQRLQNRLAERLANSSSPQEVKAIEGLRTLLSPEALNKARTAGKAVAPFSIENVIQSTNLLELIARDASNGDTEAEKLINFLSQGQASHIDVTDRIIAQKILEHQENLDFRHNLDVSGYGIDQYVERIGQSRINAASSKAMNDITNIFDPRYLTQAAYRKVTQEGINKVQIDVTADYLVDKQFFSRADIEAKFGSDVQSLRLKYDPQSGSFKFFGPSADGGFYTESLDYSNEVEARVGKNAKTFVQDQIDRIRALSTLDSPELGDPIIHSLGISGIQMSNIERVGKTVSLSRASNSGSVRAFKDLLDQQGKITTSGQEELFDALVATRQHIGFNYMDDFDGIGSTVSSGISRLMRGRHDIPKVDSMEAYARNLSKIDLLSASMDPRVRSTAVGISSLPSVASAASENIGFISKAVTPLVDQSMAGMTYASSAERETERVAQIAARSALLKSQLENNARYLSEMGAVTFETQKGLVAGDKITLASFDILKKAETVNKQGEKISLFGDEGLMMRGNKARLSITERATGETTVNMVYGGGYKETIEERLERQSRRSAAARGAVGKTVDERRAAVRAADMASDSKRLSTEAISIFDAIQASVDEALGTESDHVQALINRGLAEDKSQASDILERFKNSRKTKEGRVLYRKFRQQYVERGIGIGSIDEEKGSKGIVSMLRAAFGDTETDVIAEQRGMRYSIGDINEGHVTAFLKQSDEAIAEAARLTGRAFDEVAEESSAPKMAEKMQAIYRTAAEDTSFFDRLRDRFSSLRVNFGFKGTDIFADRLARDENIFARMDKIKPGIYTGVAAVAALSAGYYIAKRQKQNNLYDEVMESQPTESVRGPMSIRDFNDMDQQMASFSSSRRDPLVTAGVVGNLDRNKVSHYKMGPRKYDHLYGR